ncbi:hypothetical protein DPMN_152172 [Dreissena polymorpha]|uniref:Uncharacterized protein n=1 Tax=Dreissena polymorpha TaxID=45954 RepID=A0A9D4FMJ6_DREPO|nr:hypothetical protein DPMN_152172 [Dreissena polymorpha]
MDQQEAMLIPAKLVIQVGGFITGSGPGSGFLSGGSPGTVPCCLVSVGPCKGLFSESGSGSGSTGGPAPFSTFQCTCV